MIEQSFEKRINYFFKDISLLERALTHSSALNEMADPGKGSNERLEFLGDSVLSLIVSKHLYERLGEMEEGWLSKLRAMIVCEKSLAQCAKKLKLGEAIKLGRGEELNGGRERTSILADATEAIIGAIYLDGGYDEVSDFVLVVFKSTIEKAISGNYHKDFKTELQELLQKKDNLSINYSVHREEGPDHDKTFHVIVQGGGSVLGSGEGKTKKEAEQNAAKAAMEVMGIVF